MNKTVCELFAGVGGFRCGLNNIKNIEDKKEEKWETVWFSQWEPAEKKTAEKKVAEKKTEKPAEKKTEDKKTAD